MEHETNEKSARSHSLRGVLALNGALLLILAAITFGASAIGQARGRGEYTMVAGGVPGGDSPAVYVVDVANQEMIALLYNPNTKLLEGIGYRSLAFDAAAVHRGGNRPTP